LSVRAGTSGLDQEQAYLTVKTGKLVNTVGTGIEATDKALLIKEK
jgi:hypothetical protein